MSTADSTALAERLDALDRKLDLVLTEVEEVRRIPALNDRHVIVLNFMRKEFEAKGDGPSIRKLTKESGVPTKELYELFPSGPAKKAAKIAGIKKPHGCI